jgi:hypothetical protein
MVAVPGNAVTVIACFGFEPLWQKSSQIAEGHRSIVAGLVAKVAHWSYQNDRALILVPLR